MTSLQGRTALVTGISSGLGEGVLRVFAVLGATVVGCARRAGQGSKLVDQLRSEGLDASFIEADVTSEADRERLIEACLQRSGRIDILINNAGALGEIALVEDASLERWDQVYDVNVKAAFALCQLSLPHMKRQRDGVILNISSINALIGITHMAAYSSSKAALTHLTRVIASEAYDFNVRANSIILGSVASEMTDDLTRTLVTRAKGEVSDAELAVARARRMHPEEVAKSLSVLCLPEARLITGSEIAIDQAWTAGRAMSGMLHGPRPKG
jgi:NAD(P)-dependent dehydrogenase (short-subunit alcohol dehydrogenase family)